jgi:hypothetical protein
MVALYLLSSIRVHGLVRTLFKLLARLVLMKTNNKVSLYSLYLKNIKREYVYPSIEGAEVVLVF